MKPCDHNADETARSGMGPTRFAATVTKVQMRPCWSFAVEVEAEEFRMLVPGQKLVVHLGWFLVSSTRIGDASVRFRGFGRPDLKVGQRIEVAAEPAAIPPRKAPGP